MALVSLGVDEVKIINYYVVASTDSAELSRKVMDFIKEGWELHGSPSVVLTATGVLLYMQSVIVKMEGK